MASGIYNIFKENLMEKNVDLVNDTIKVALLNSSFSFVVSDTVFLNTHEISGTGYSAGGNTLSGKSVGLSGNSAVWTASNLLWPSSTFSAAFALIYDSSVASATGDLIAAIDFGGTVSVSGGIFEIQWSGSGIISIG